MATRRFSQNTAYTGANLDWSDIVPFSHLPGGANTDGKVTLAELRKKIGWQSHNIPRPGGFKDITSYYTAGELHDRISSGYEDIFVGDYFKMKRSIMCQNTDTSNNNGGSQWVTVAGCGVLAGIGDNATPPARHLVLVPGQGEGGQQSFGRHGMNSTNTTEGGYKGSEMNTSVIGAVCTDSGSTEAGATINQQLKAEFGSLLITTRELLSNTLNKTGVNRLGTADGCASNWEWATCQAVLMSEAEVYGTTVWSSSGYDTGNACRQLPLFFFSKLAMNNRTAWYWLKSIASASRFCYFNSHGGAAFDGAGNATIFVRPRFAIA